MRITRSMMVNNMEYWASKQTEKLNDAQTVVASGKQINKPSDDPEATGQILKDRATISVYGQYESNISQAQTWIETSNTTLDSVNSLLQEAQDVLSSLSTGDAGTSASEELGNIYEQVLSLVNSRYGSGYRYSGNHSATIPYSNNVEVSGGVSSDIMFDLAADASEVTVEITDSTGAIVRTLTTTSGGVEGTNTITWDGCNEDGNLLSDGDYGFTVSASDEEGNAVASYPSYRGDEGGKEIIIGENSIVTLNNDGSKIFGNALKTLSQAITALKDTGTDSTVISDLSASLEDASSQIEADQVILSNKNSLLENSTSRLDELKTYVNGRISDTEVGSTERAAVELQAQETAYETTLEAAAKVLKMPKLSDYLS